MKLEQRGGNRKIKDGNSRLVPIVVAAVIVVVIIGVLVTFFEWRNPEVKLQKELSRLGPATDIGIIVRDSKSGVRSLSAHLEQDGKQFKLFEKVFLRQDVFPYNGPKEVEESQHFNIRALGIDEGDAVLVITARDFSLWGWFDGNIYEQKIPVIIDTSPPIVQVGDRSRQIRPGSAGIVVFKVNEPLEKGGVVINGYFHPGYAIAGEGSHTYTTTIALPYDNERIKESYVLAVDLTGNETSVPFGLVPGKSEIKTDRINISDSFLDRKIPEFEKYYPDITGTAVEKYVYINNEIRRENARKIQEICSNSRPEKLWDGPFQRMAGSSRMAGFAERRSYFYNDRKIDTQTHLGIDLASVKFAEVHAANRGVVVFADYLGIYGNAVIIDHGIGVFSLYSHLSQISVQAGSPVEKGAVIGLTGTTGMAGGDHLHFSMLVNGIFVNPVEWWDGHWLRFNILELLPRSR